MKDVKWHCHFLKEGPHWNSYLIFWGVSSGEFRSSRTTVTEIKLQFLQLISKLFEKGYCRFLHNPGEQFLICSNIGQNVEFIFKGRIQKHRLRWQLTWMS